MICTCFLPCSIVSLLQFRMIAALDNVGHLFTKQHETNDGIVATPGTGSSRSQFDHTWGQDTMKHLGEQQDSSVHSYYEYHREYKLHSKTLPFSPSSSPIKSAQASSYSHFSRFHKDAATENDYGETMIAWDNPSIVQSTTMTSLPTRSPEVKVQLTHQDTSHIEGDFLLSGKEATNLRAGPVLTKTFTPGSTHYRSPGYAIQPYVGNTDSMLSSMEWNASSSTKEQTQSMRWKPGISSTLTTSSSQSMYPAQTLQNSNANEDMPGWNASAAGAVAITFLDNEKDFLNLRGGKGDSNGGKGQNGNCNTMSSKGTSKWNGKGTSKGNGKGNGMRGKGGGKGAMRMGGKGMMKSSKKSVKATPCPTTIEPSQSYSPSPSTNLPMPTRTLSPASRPTFAPQIAPLPLPTKRPVPPSASPPTIVTVSPIFTVPTTPVAPILITPSATFAPTLTKTSSPILAPSPTSSLVPSQFSSSSGPVSLVPSLFSSSSGPVALPVLSPTLAPNVLPPTAAPNSPPTPAPNNRPTTPVPFSPFSLSFEGVSNPTPQAYDEAERIVLEYLDGFLSEQFALSLEFEYADLVASLLTEGIGPQPSTWVADYDADALFFNASPSLPTTPELDVLLDVAFAMPQVAELLTLLQALRSTNPFSTVTSVIYTSPI